MPHYRFRDVQTWVFDLDNTLYHPSARLFDQIEVKMTEYVMREVGVDREEADMLRAAYWRDYGTTLNGLMTVHDADPGRYLDDVHDIDLTALAPDPGLRSAIDALPGRKIIHTNGPLSHADRILAARGLTGLFDAAYGIEESGFLPKPDLAAFQAIWRLDGLDPAGAAMVEDDVRNLSVPRAEGMRTLWVTETPREADVDAATDDLTDFLERVMG
ncbi:MAG: pyrimidine 5'-nucleotidase [Pseudomonadota bacterium]